MFINANAHGLFPLLSASGVADDVVFQDNVFGLTANADASDFTLKPVIFNQVVFQPVAMRRHSDCFVSEKHALLLVETDLVVPKQIVGVFVPN
jgi:hypothetical protein